MDNRWGYSDDMYIYLMTVKQQASLVKEGWLKLRPQFPISLLNAICQGKYALVPLPP